MTIWQQQKSRGQIREDRNLKALARYQDVLQGKPTKADLYADLAQAVRNTIATPENAVPPDTTPVNAAFTKKAQGIPRKGGKIQFNMSWPKELFERIRDEAFAANQSFSERAMIYFRRGLQNEEGEPHGN